jgi:hypothetical protein
MESPHPHSNNIVAKICHPQSVDLSILLFIVAERFRCFHEIAQFEHVLLYRVSREELHKPQTMINQLILNKKNVILICVLFGTVMSCLISLQSQIFMNLLTVKLLNSLT